MGTPTRPVRVPYDVDHNPRSTVLPGRVNPDLSVPIPATHALRIQPTQTASTPAFAWLSDGRCAACQMAVLTILSARVRQCGMTLRGGDGRASASTLWTITRTRLRGTTRGCRRSMQTRMRRKYECVVRLPAEDCLLPKRRQVRHTREPGQRVGLQVRTTSR